MCVKPVRINAGGVRLAFFGYLKTVIALESRLHINIARQIRKCAHLAKRNPEQYRFDFSVLDFRKLDHINIKKLYINNQSF